MKLRPLAPRDLVLRKVVGAAKNPSWGKLGPKLGRTIPNYFSSKNRCILFRRLR